MRCTESESDAPGAAFIDLVVEQRHLPQKMINITTFFKTKIPNHVIHSIGSLSFLQSLSTWGCWSHLVVHSTDKTASKVLLCTNNLEPELKLQYLDPPVYGRVHWTHHKVTLLLSKEFELLASVRLDIGKPLTLNYVLESGTVFLLIE